MEQKIHCPGLFVKSTTNIRTISLTFLHYSDHFLVSQVWAQSNKLKFPLTYANPNLHVQSLDILLFLDLMKGSTVAFKHSLTSNSNVDDTCLLFNLAHFLR